MISVKKLIEYISMESIIKKRIVIRLDENKSLTEIPEGIVEQKCFYKINYYLFLFIALSSKRKNKIIIDIKQMFDRKCKDCIVLKRIKNAFVREELKNSELIIQNGKTYDDAIIINEQGKEILEFINNKRTVEEIINLMIQKYPEVEKDVVENDVYSFLYEGERREIIKVRGVEKMYKGHDIKRINDFEIYRCSEGDLKLIYKILNDQDTILDMRDYNTPEELYNANNYVCFND